MEKLLGIHGSQVKLETKDGILLRGQLTGFETYSFKVNGEEVKMISEVVLDNDQEKKVELVRLHSIEEI